MPDSGADVLLAHDQLLKIIAEAIAQTISHHTHLEISIGTAQVLTSPVPQFDAGAMIRYEDAQFQSEVVLGLPRGLQQGLQESLFQAQSLGEFDQPDVDLAGEFLNVAFGSIDPRAQGLGHRLRSSFPQILPVAKLREILEKTKADKLVIPLTAGPLKIALLVLAGGTLPGPWKYTIKQP